MFRKSTKGWVKHIDFTVIELLCLFVSLYLGSGIRHSCWSIAWFWNKYSLLVIIMLAADFLLSIILHSYNKVLRRGKGKEAYATLKLMFFTWMVTFGCLYVAHIAQEYSRIVIGLAAVFHFALTYVTRILWKKVVRKINSHLDDNTLLIIASRDEAADIVSQISRDAFNYNKIIGIATFEEPLADEVIEGTRVIACADNVVEYVQKNWVDEVIVALTPGTGIPTELVEALTDMGVTVHVRVDMNRHQSAGLKQVISKKGDMLLITNSRKFMSRSDATIKRVMDILGGLVGCVIVGILYLFVAPKIKKESPGPVFFKQTRIGRNGRTFQMYKFRSMYLDADKRKEELIEKNNIRDGYMFKMDFDPRVIGNYIDEKGVEHRGIGDRIRRKSIDEFPQFINVLKGDMSLVGTRPPTPDEYEKYELHHKSRLAFPVGVTGLWQVSGRSDITDFEEVVKLDNQYIDNWSIGLDIKIIWKTIGVVLKGKGAR